MRSIGHLRRVGSCRRIGTAVSTVPVPFPLRMSPDVTCTRPLHEANACNRDRHEEPRGSTRTIPAADPLCVSSVGLHRPKLQCDVLLRNTRPVDSSYVELSSPCPPEQASQTEKDMQRIQIS